MSDLITAKRGSTLLATLQVRKDGAAVNLTGCTDLRIGAKARVTDTVLALDITTTPTADGSLTIVDAAAGHVRLEVTALKLSAIAPAPYFIALQFTHPTDGVVEIPSNDVGYRITVIPDLI